MKTNGKRGLRDEILKMFAHGHPVPEIAKALGCSRENVHRVLARRGIRAKRSTWNEFIHGLPEHVRSWLLREVRRTKANVHEIATALLIDAVELAIEEEADLRCKNTTNKIDRTPLPAHWGVRAGNQLTPKTVSGFAVRARGSASAGTS